MSTVSMTNPMSSMDSVYYDIQPPVTVSMDDIVAITLTSMDHPWMAYTHQSNPPVTVSMDDIVDMTSLNHPWMAYTHQSNPLSQYPWMT